MFSKEVDNTIRPSRGEIFFFYKTLYSVLLPFFFSINIKCFGYCFPGALVIDGSRLNRTGAFLSATMPQDLEDAQPSLGRGLRQLLDFEGDVEATFARSFQLSYEVQYPPFSILYSTICYRSAHPSAGYY